MLSPLAGYKRNSALHERQLARRRALSVPQASQRLYIVRANQFVISALKKSMPRSSATLSRVSLNLYTSPSSPDDKPGRARNRDGMHPARRHPRGAR